MNVVSVSPVDAAARRALAAEIQEKLAALVPTPPDSTAMVTVGPGTSLLIDGAFLAEVVSLLDVREAGLQQACMNLATIRPLDVMKPGEDLSLGECQERWLELVLEQSAAAVPDGPVSEEKP